jgi:hypothetical protein
LHFLPPHASDQTQTLDIGVLGLQKMDTSKISIAYGFNPQTEQLLRILRGFYIAATPYNVIQAFRVGEVCVRFSQCNEALLAFIDQKTTKSVRNWKAAKQQIPVDSLDPE